MQITPNKRTVEVLVLSDIHLGTYGCHAKELLQYLDTIDPKMVILNGDIIDMWQFSKRYWPPTHMQVVKYIMNYVVRDIPVYYLVGNHDEMLRKFKGFCLGSLTIDNKLSLKLNGKKVWIFHGDVFDVVMQHSKWLAKLGAVGYDSLILLNRFVNFISEKMGKGKISLSKKIKNGVKSAVAFINQFEQTICDIATDNEYQYVICGHIHEPANKSVNTPNGPVHYLNSGDWIENLTSLEYNNNEWKLYRYFEDEQAQSIQVSTKEVAKEKTKELLDHFLSEMKIVKVNAV